MADYGTSVDRQIYAAKPPTAGTQTTWAKVIDHTKCIGCHACTTACKSENDVPVGVTRTYVKYVEVGQFPDTRRAFQVTRCNQCQHPPCVAACPTSAMFRRSDGIVDFDKTVCIGCKACIAACPYDAIFMNPEDHSAEKCNFCAHRVDRGLEPACVVVCPAEAIIIGDIKDPASRIAETLRTAAVAVRRPEKETLPKLFYVGADQNTLDPLAARRPSGNLFMWSQQGPGQSSNVTSGHPGAATSSAAALLAYDVPHRAPWHWPVSLYTATKGIASGVYLVALLLIALGAIGPSSVLWRWTAPIIACVFLLVTGALLIADLEHPARFYLIFVRPQWRSWLVRGAYIIAAYSAVLGVHLLATITREDSVSRALSVLGGPLAALTAVYTAYLFAQAKARDLWQNPLLPLHMLVQAILLGAAALLCAGPWTDSAVRPLLLRVVAYGGASHLALVAVESTLPHATAHAQLAAWEMLRGRFRFYFWASSALMLLSVGAPWLGSLCAIAVLVGVTLYDHAYVQAAQSVPLA